MDKKLVAEKIRARLEQRIANLLECKPSELPRMKLGTLCHCLFMLDGHNQELGGFNTSMSSLLHLVGESLVWDIEETTPPAEKIEVIN